MRALRLHCEPMEHSFAAVVTEPVEPLGQGAHPRRVEWKQAMTKRIGQPGDPG
jgi:hypothetical protein